MDTTLFKWSGVFVLLFCVGFLRTDRLYSKQLADHPSSKFEALVVRPAELRGKYQHLEIKVVSSNRVFKVTTSLYPEYRYGDLIEVSDFTSEQEWIGFPTIKFIAHNRGNIVMANGYALRNRLVEQVNQLLPEPQASLLTGIVFGIEQDLGTEMNSAFRRAGLIHIVVASGFNISIVIAYLANLAKFFRQKVGFVLIVIGVVLYSFLAGSNPPVVRAAIMGVATLLAVATGRRKQALLWLVFAMISMLIANPILYRSLSLQMSFSATLAILLFQERWEQLFYFFPRLIREDMATTMAVQLLLVPLIWRNVGQVQPAVFITNPLTLWVVPLIMPLGMVSTTLSILSVPLARVSILPVRFMLDWVLWIVRLFT